MKYVLFTLVKFYLHLLTELVSSKKYWRVANSSVSVLKEEIQVIFFFVKSLQKSKRNEEN